MQQILIVLTLFLLICVPVTADGSACSPEAVTKDIRLISENDSKTLISETEYQAVMNADFDSIVQILSNLEGACDLFPNIKESCLVLSDNDIINRKILASYKILGIGRSYSYIEKINFHRKSDNEFTIESELIRSLDKRINNYRGVWHISRLPDSLDGRSQSSVSLYSYFDYNKPFFMQNLILDAFTDNEVADMFSCVENAALRK